MPGFLGGSTSSGGAGGTTEFVPAKEFVDPVTKFRVSNPANLIDTDFEYGLQPTKWETVELINNTPSFFSKSGDTTIPNIINMSTIAGSREITVTTSLEHGLSVGIPINVRGSKSLTADGAYIVGSIPDEFTFTYLAKVNQLRTESINDLYTVVITGEFFQGSQIRISNSAGIEVETPVGASNSTLTVRTESPHGFGVNTPFYFLNLNSSISQEFDASNTLAKSFDSSNSATAQTFDGSNSAVTQTYNLSNNAFTAGNAPSNITNQNTLLDTITVQHGSENFDGSPVGTPVYYSVSAASGFFNTNPRGIVFLKDVSNLGTTSSTFTVSEIPDGTAIAIDGALSGFFQLADQAYVFAGNNLNFSTQVAIDIVEDPAQQFDGANENGDSLTVTTFSGSLISGTSDSGSPDLSWDVDDMVFYTTDGAAAAGLTDNTTYWIDTIFQQGDTNTYSFTVKETPDGSAVTSVSGGTGTQQFSKIGVSLDKDYISLRNHGFNVGDMLRYDYPASGRFTATGGDAGTANYFYVESTPNIHTFNISRSKGGVDLNLGQDQFNAVDSPRTLWDLSQEYYLDIESGTYWVDYQGTPTQMFIDMDGSQAGSSVGGWGLIDTNFVHNNRPSPIGEITVFYTYDGTASTGRYNASRDGDELRTFSWIMPSNDTRGVRIETAYYDDAGNAESGLRYNNATNLYNAANGSRINVGGNRGYAGWVAIPPTNDGNYHQIITSGGVPRDGTLTNYGGNTDDVGFDYNRIMWYHADGTSEEILPQSYRVWIR